MAKKKKNFSPQKITAILASLILLAVSALITYGRQIDLPFSIPTWQQIFSGAGLSGNNNFDYPLSVHFIDVGQGDCSLIVCGDNAVLIDGGERGESEKILDYLYEYGIDSLDCVIATHPHSDHIGGLINVLENIETKNILMPALTEENIPTTKVYSDFLAAVKASSAAVFAALPNDNYSYGKISFRVLAPVSQEADLNNMSVVVLLEYGDSSFIFTGDAEKSSELEMLKEDYDISADVIKVGHHGSSTSSADIFIEAVEPKYAVISCGAENSYGHPHSETLALLELNKISVFRTDLNGDIVFGVDEHGINVNVQKE